jgi:Fic family protein
MKWKEIRLEDEIIQENLIRIDGKKNLLTAARPMPRSALQKINEALNIEWTYNSNSIEGNTLTLNETKLVIENGMTIRGKSLREHFEAVNHQEAIEYIHALAQKSTPLRERDVLDTHLLVLDKIEKEFSGRYRNAGVRIGGANFIPPNALKVNDLMQELIYWYNKESDNFHPIVRAAVFHHRFVWIHPFFDGNGRTARLLMNLLLMKEKFPPAIILKNDRKKYYDALNKANQGDYTKLILLVFQAAERTINIYLNNLNNSIEEYQSIADIVEEPDIIYSQEYVSLLARQGKIDAYKEGRVWYSSKKAIQQYIKNRKRAKSLS